MLPFIQDLRVKCKTRMFNYETRMLGTKSPGKYKNPHMKYQTRLVKNKNHQLNIHVNTVKNKETPVQ
jgi:hypothetical protein